MTTAELKEKGAIFFERIEEGFAEYKDEKFTYTADEALAVFRKMLAEYSAECAFADFYYHVLPEEAQEKIRKCLNDEEMQYVNQLPRSEEKKEIVFPLDDMLLQIVTKLNANEMLFSTIYFLEKEEKPAMTWWGNYQKEYYCFKKDF